MTSNPVPSRREFIIPLAGGRLLDIGQVFPREELLRRILSLFWWNCCGTPGIPRPPAPVLELLSGGPENDGLRLRARAWWVLHDGIVEDSEGPHAERLSLFFGNHGEQGQLWPRYDFEVHENPLLVEMNFHRHARLHWRTRISLESRPDGRLEVTARHAAADP